jgi:hypothetical protein
VNDGKPTPELARSHRTTEFRGYLRNLYAPAMLTKRDRDGFGIAPTANLERRERCGRMSDSGIKKSLCELGHIDAAQK